MATCPLCRHSSLRIIAAITQVEVLTRSLRHLQFAAVPLPIRNRRGDCLLELAEELPLRCKHKDSTGHRSPFSLC